MSREALVFYSDVDDVEAWRQVLAEELPDLEFRTSDSPGDPNEVLYALAWKPPAGFFTKYRNLKLLTNLGAGIDSLLGRDDLGDVPICRLNDPGMEGLMKSYVLFAVTRYARDIPIYEDAKRRGTWTYVHPRPLAQIRVGVLGLGELGLAAAQALSDLGFTVSGWARSEKSVPGIECHAGREALDGFLASNEIIVSMLPLTPDTRAILGQREFAAMPRGAKFINASRGPVVDEDAMIAALRSGQLGGATLDVFSVEPLPDGHPLWSLDNVLITPHLASITVPAASGRVVAENIRRVRQGLDPLHQANPTRGY